MYTVFGVLRNKNKNEIYQLIKHFSKFYKKF